MRKIILLLSLLTTVAHAQFDTRAIETKVINGVFGYRNLITNPSCKRNIAGITGSVVAAVRNTTTALDGITDCTWNPTATSQTLTYAYDSLPAGLKGQNCEARILYLGDASLVKANVQINSVNVASDLQLTNSGTNAAVASINYPCGDGSTATTLVLTSTGDAANVQYAVYGGQATNLNSGSQVTPWVAYTPTVQGFGTLTNVSVFYRIVGGNIEIQGKFQAGTVTAVEGRIYLPTGYTSADTTRIATIQGVGHWWQANPTVAPGAILIEPSVTYVTLGSGSSGNNSFTKLNGSGVSASNELVGFFASVPLSGQGLATTINSNISGSYYSGYHDSTCAWARTNVAYGAFTADASCNLTQRQASGIGAVATGSVLPALALTLPATGTYYVCAYVNSYAAGNGGLRMTDGTTVIVESNDQSTTRTTKALCGSYVASSLTPTISIEGKSSSGAITIDTSSTNSAIEWTIFPVTNNMPAPVLVGSITSNATGAERLERAAVTSTCSASPCTIASQSGSWLTNITRASTGNYSINFAAGMFSAAPTCNIIATGLIATINTNPTTSAVVIDTKNTAGTSTDAQFFVQCMGPR